MTTSKIKELFLSPDCELVYGVARVAIYDFRRQGCFLLPHNIADMINIIGTREGLPLVLNDDIELDTIKYLIEMEYCYTSLPRGIFTTPNNCFDSSIISNAILYYSTIIPIQDVVDQFNSLITRKIEIRISDVSSLHSFQEYIKLFKTSCFQDITLTLDNVVLKEQEAVFLINHLPQLSEVNIFSSNEDKHISINHVCLNYFHGAATTCNPQKMPIVLNRCFFNESKRYNNCLYRKVTIKENGDITNCPLSTKNFGNVCHGDSIFRAVQTKEFQRYWLLTKDKVTGCSDCELRYVCQDCRVDFSGEFSTIKPYWCDYPYQR